MTAQEQMRRMLDELMGTRRNGEDTREDKLHYSHTRVCKSFLLYCCPHEILAATRADLGNCKRVHDVALRADYENSTRKYELSFQKEALHHLKTFVADSERRTKVAKVKLAETQEILGAESAARLDKISKISQKIDELLIKAEGMGAVGNVEGSLETMEEVEALKKEKEDAEEAHRNATPASIAQQQKLRVCEVCSSYLGVHDNDKRLADHFNGKLHLGFMEIREKLSELEELVEDHHIKSVVSNEFEKGYSFNRNTNSEPSELIVKHKKPRHHSPDKADKDKLMFYRRLSSEKQDQNLYKGSKYKSPEP